MNFAKIFPKVTDDFGYWLAGFVDGEGCFSIIPSSKYSYQVMFSISQRTDDVELLYKIKDLLGIGLVNERHSGYSFLVRGKLSKSQPFSSFSVKKRSDVLKIAVLFEKYSLRSRKQNDFEIWKLAAKEYAINGSSRPGLFEEYINALKKVRLYNESNSKFVELSEKQLSFAIDKEQ